MLRHMTIGLVVLGLLAPSARPQGIALVADVNPGPGGGGASSLTVYNGELYFVANDLPHGSDSELWKYDGTGAVRVADINPGPEGSTPSDLTVYDGKLYFAASGATGPRRLYEFDGTSHSLTPGYTASQTPGEFIVFDNKLLFRASAFGTYGTELWTFDGTGQTVIDLVPGTGSSGPKELTEFNGALYLNAVNQELWRLNAAATGAVQVTDVANGQGSSPEHLVVFHNDLYFSAYDHVHGRELWRYNGGDPVMVADIKPGGQYDSGNPSFLTVYRDAIYFSADNGVDGHELWRHDGVTTEMVANINPTPFEPGVDPVHDSWPSEFFVFEDVLYFAADDGEHGRELWSCDGQQVRLVADIYPGQYGSSVGGFAVYDGKLYFYANNGQLGGELNTFLDAPALFVIPEPATAGLVALGSLLLLLRRRPHRER